MFKQDIDSDPNIQRLDMLRKPVTYQYLCYFQVPHTAREACLHFGISKSYMSQFLGDCVRLGLIEVVDMQKAKEVRNKPMLNVYQTKIEALRMVLVWVDREGAETAFSTSFPLRGNGMNRQQTRLDDA